MSELARLAALWTSSPLVRQEKPILTHLPSTHNDLSCFAHLAHMISTPRPALATIQPPSPSLSFLKPTTLIMPHLDQPPTTSFEVLRILSLIPSRSDKEYASDITTAALELAFPAKAKARRPKTGNESQLALDRDLTLKDEALMLARVSNGLVKKSQSTYAAGLLRFTQFCDERGISEDRRMPADATLLACFISSSIGAHGLACAKNWLNGVHYWHIINNAPWHGDGPLIRKILCAIDKENPSKLPSRGPITKAHLQCLRRNLDITSPQDAVFWALACCAFWGCRRLGELTLETISGFDGKHHNTKRATRMSSLTPY
ncbi:hypothetical protein C8F01DRAFT_1331752 [Mycena amicta]|nr:hypothetical protein C8F01DRAFT_1331752 [Mycena amicta]